MTTILTQGEYEGMFAGIVVLGIMALILIHSIDLIQSKVCPWIKYEEREII